MSHFRFFVVGITLITQKTPDCPEKNSSRTNYATSKARQLEHLGNYLYLYDPTNYGTSNQALQRATTPKPTSTHTHVRCAYIGIFSSNRFVVRIPYSGLDLFS